MPGLKEVEQMLNTFIRPSTFPVAIKMLNPEDEMPERTRRPLQQMKKKVAICQGIGMTQDHEMSFMIPMSKMDTVLDGLAKTHKGGIRYPITSFFNFEATFPPSYQEQMKIWEAEGEI